MSTPDKGVIRTVTGDVEARDIGWTLIHEHIISSLAAYWVPDFAPEVATKRVSIETLSEVRRHAFSVRDNLILEDIELAIREVGAFAAAGGRTIVEVTSHGIQRDVLALEVIARRSGLQVIAGCGYYIRASHPRGLHERSERSIAAELVEELTSGIAGTAIRAGVIGELGVGSYPMHRAERKVLRAGAKAQKATGAGIVVHSAPGSTESVFEILGVLGRAGAQMDKVVVSHLDERFRDDLRAFRRVAATGAVFGFDTFGREIYYDARRRQHPSDSQRIEMICRLLDAGLGDHLALAQDVCLKHELASNGGQGYAHVPAAIVPRLRDAGVPDAAIEQMLTSTPARVLALRRGT